MINVLLHTAVNYVSALVDVWCSDITAVSDMLMFGVRILQLLLILVGDISVLTLQLFLMWLMIWVFDITTVLIWLMILVLFTAVSDLVCGVLTL